MSRTAPSGAAPSTGTDVGLVAFLGAAGVGALLWAGGAASALVSGHRVPKGRYLAGFEALGHFGAPSVAWGSPVGPAPLYWALTRKPASKRRASTCSPAPGSSPRASDRASPAPFTATRRS